MLCVMIVRPNRGFKRFAKITNDIAGRIYGLKSAEQQAVRGGWPAVGIAAWRERRRRYTVRIEFSQAGGIVYFPGLNKPITVEVDQLDVKDAEELKRLVDASHFFDLPAAIGLPVKGIADYQFYTLAISDNDRQHSVRILVPVEDPALLDLIQAVQNILNSAPTAIQPPSIRTICPADRFHLYHPQSLRECCNSQ